MRFFDKLKGRMSGASDILDEAEEEGYVELDADSGSQSTSHITIKTQFFSFVLCQSRKKI